AAARPQEGKGGFWLEEGNKAVKGKETRYRPVEAKVDFPALEREVLDFWRSDGTFQKSLALREGKPEWVFYEGPPTANGKPGIHHAEARVFKDIYPRYKTMRGFFVPRKA